MSTDEKISMLYGAIDPTSHGQAGFLPGGPRLGLPPLRLADGPAGRGVYSEGISVGYRWYDQQRLEPLFPFGHGLSYTTFSYSGLSVRRGADGY